MFSRVILCIFIASTFYRFYLAHEVTNGLPYVSSRRSQQEGGAFCAPAGVWLMTLNQVEENLLIELETESGGVAINRAVTTVNATQQ